jgi:hypothetical protein
LSRHLELAVELLRALGEVLHLAQALDLGQRPWRDDRGPERGETQRNCHVPATGFSRCAVTVSAPAAKGATNPDRPAGDVLKLWEIQG